MILHELFGQHLRAGNFIFQKAAQTKLSLVHNCDVMYPESYYLWKYLKNPPKTYTEEPKFDELIRPHTWHWTPEEEEYVNSFGERYQNENMAFALNFFFQSAKWWEGYEKEIVESLQFIDDYVNFVKNKYEHLFRRPTIGWSIRLGDFKHHGDFFQIPKEFYPIAVQENFPNWQDYNIVVFSDHIEDAQTMFKGENLYFAEPNGTHTHADNFKHYHSEKAIEQLVLGTLMDNFIIGNSTFSWWQAFLGAEQKGGKVVHSGQVFRGHYQRISDISNYYYPTWIKCHPYNENGLIKSLDNELKKLLK